MHTGGRETLAEGPERLRLAAVLAADVAGFTRLMADDERATMAALEAARAVFQEQVSANSGRVVDTAGDSVLALFDNAAGAVEAALAIQQLLHGTKPEADFPALRFRIGIHLGDIHEKADGTIYGDGVNVAARLEGLGEPGTVTVSDAVRQTVERQFAAKLFDLGDHAVKNVDKPVRAYRVLTDGESAPVSKTVPRRLRKLAFAGIAVVIAGGLATWQVLSPGGEAPDSARPSIAVLPFATMSEDADQEHFADGMTDDLITDLAKISGLFVIARNSSFSYKGRSVNVQEVGSELGVRYVLEGSVRRAEGMVRINAQLIDARDGGHVWAETFDRPYDGIFALQDEVTGKIVEALAVSLTDTEQAQIARAPTGNLDAYEAYQRGLDIMYRFDFDRYGEGMEMFDRAIALDPDFAEAHAGLAFLTFFIGFINDGGIGEWTAGAVRERSRQSAARALAVDPNSGRAHAVHAWQQAVDRSHDAAIAAADRAISLAPNDVWVGIAHARVHYAAGLMESAVQSFDKVLARDPYPTPGESVMLGWTSFFLRKHDEALRQFANAKTTMPLNYWVEMGLAVTHAKLGNLELAQESFANILPMWPASNWEAFKWGFSYWKRPEDVEHFVDAFRKAGASRWPMGFEGDEALRLGQDELKSLFGKTLVGFSFYDSLPAQSTGSQGDPFTFEIEQRGEWTFTNRSGAYRGSSWTEGDRNCYQGPDSNRGQVFCFPTYRNPQGTQGDHNTHIFPTFWGIHDFAIEPAQ